MSEAAPQDRSERSPDRPAQHAPLAPPGGLTATVTTTPRHNASAGQCRRTPSGIRRCAKRNVPERRAPLLEGDVGREPLVEAEGRN